MCLSVTRSRAKAASLELLEAASEPHIFYESGYLCSMSHSLNFISPALIGILRRFSTGASGQTHLSLYAHDGL